MHSSNDRQSDNPIGMGEYESDMATSAGTAQSSGHTYVEQKKYGTYTGFEGESGQAGSVKSNEHSGKHEEKSKGKTGTKGHLGGAGMASAEWKSGQPKRFTPR